MTHPPDLVSDDLPLDLPASASTSIRLDLARCTRCQGAYSGFFRPSPSGHAAAPPTGTTYVREGERARTRKSGQPTFSRHEADSDGGEGGRSRFRADAHGALQPEGRRPRSPRFGVREPERRRRIKLDRRRRRPKNSLSWCSALEPAVYSEKTGIITSELQDDVPGVQGTLATVLH